MEMSHRGKEFQSIIDAAEADLRALLAIPDNYTVLFMQVGGQAGAGQQQRRQNAIDSMLCCGAWVGETGGAALPAVRATAARCHAGMGTSLANGAPCLQPRRDVQCRVPRRAQVVG